MLSSRQRMSELEELHPRIAPCPDCDLCRTRSHVVPGEGPPDAEVLLVGEAPGFHEDQQARPFVGPAGRFLDELIASIGLRRGQGFFTNVVKWRAPNNPAPPARRPPRRHHAPHYQRRLRQDPRRAGTGPSGATAARRSGSRAGADAALLGRWLTSSALSPWGGWGRSARTR